MVRFFGVGLAGLITLAIWLYAVFDVIKTDESLVRNMPKHLWLIVIIFIPFIGSLAWLMLGRPEKAGFQPGDTQYRRPIRPQGPEDSPTFMSDLDERSKRLRRWEDELKQREDELKRKEDGSSDP